MENVELVRRCIEAMNARDHEAVEGLAGADMEWRPILKAGGDLERQVYRGPAGVLQYFADLDELFEATEVQVEELEPIGLHHVLFGGRVTARGRRSGVPLDEHIWSLWEIRARKLHRGTAYRTRAEALEAVGPSD